MGGLGTRFFTTVTKTVTVAKDLNLEVGVSLGLAVSQVVDFIGEGASLSIAVYPTTATLSLHFELLSCGVP